MQQNITPETIAITTYQAVVKKFARSVKVPCWVHRDVQMYARTCFDMHEAVLLEYENSFLEFTLKRSVKIPDTWWDHFKDTYFNAWLLRYFPVKYKYFEQYKVCPHVKIPEDRRHLEWLSLETPPTFIK